MKILTRNQISQNIACLATIGLAALVQLMPVSASASIVTSSQEALNLSSAQSVALTLAGTTSTDTQQPKTKHSIPWLGPQFGTFLPTSSKVRDRFGDSWTAIALGLGQITQPSDHHAAIVDYNVIFNKSGDNYALIAPVGIAYQQFFGGNRKANPYIGASADLVFASIRSDEDHVKSGLTAVPGGSVFTGISFGRRAFLEARYTAVSKVEGFDLSGTNITLGFRF